MDHILCHGQENINLIGRLILTINFVCLLTVPDYLGYVYSEPGFNSKLFLQPVHCDKRGLAQSLAHYCSSRLNFTTTQVSVRFDPNSIVSFTVMSFLSFLDFLEVSTILPSSVFSDLWDDLPQSSVLTTAVQWSQLRANLNLVNSQLS